MVYKWSYVFVIYVVHKPVPSSCYIVPRLLTINLALVGDIRPNVNVYMKHSWQSVRTTFSTVQNWKEI